MIRRLLTIFGGILVFGAIGAGVFFSVKYAYGAYDDKYFVVAEMDRAGQQLKLGGDVRIRGVDVGKIAGIELVDRRARVTLEIEGDKRVPRAVEAVVSLKTPLGAKYIDLRFDPNAGPPYLEDGDAIADAHVGPELEDLLDDGTRLLDAVDPDELATIVNELADASSGHGQDVNRGLVANSELSDLFAATTRPQLEAFEDFDTIFGALDEVGVDLNQLADAINEGVPVYASEEAQRNLRAALEAVVPFSEDLADLLILNREDWDRMFDQGDIVFSTIAARPGGLRNLVTGLAMYVTKLGGDIDPFFRMDDGSAGAGFTAFIGGNDQEEEENQLCDAFPEEIDEQVPFCKERRR